MGKANNNADGKKKRHNDADADGDAARHLRRFVLSVETQIGKTGAYTWFLKLLADEIHGDTIPQIPKSPGALLVNTTMTDKLKWRLPYWRALCRQANDEPTFNGNWKLDIMVGKYHSKVKLQRMRLLLSALRSGGAKWHDVLIERLEGLGNNGECIQTQFHIDKVDKPQKAS